MCDLPDNSEIEYTSRKADEIIAVLDGLETVLHMEEDDEYDDPLVTVEVINPYKGKNMYIELSGEFTLFWGDWHTHYPPCEQDFLKMLEDIRRIIKSEMGTLCLYLGEKWLSSRLWQGHISYDEALRELKQDDCLYNFIKGEKEGAVTIRADYWQPGYSAEYNIPVSEFKRNGGKVAGVLETVLDAILRT